MSALARVAAVVVDCREAASLAAFYQSVFGGEIIRTDEDSAWLRVGDLTVICRAVDGYQPPTWPASVVPMQVHLDLWVDDLARQKLSCTSSGPSPPTRSHPVPAA
jgi:catechol-2,3-dioxygenase